MVYKKIDKNWMIRLEKGEEVITSLTKFCLDKQIKTGTISGIGAVNHVTIGFFDTTKNQYTTKEFSDDYEITSLVGNISIKEEELHLHIHINIATKEFNVFGGHLYSARISATCEINLIEFGDIIYRKLDPATNLFLLDL